MTVLCWIPAEFLKLFIAYVNNCMENIKRMLEVRVESMEVVLVVL